LRALRKVGGVGTAEVIAAHLRADRANISGLLNEMSRERVVELDQASLMPGVKADYIHFLWCSR
jgi:hypothetical protein